MQQVTLERRTCERRQDRAGGRRASDAPADATAVPTCPNCYQAGLAVLAGESDGGWWFVCVDCDHMWDQRQITTEPESVPDALFSDQAQDRNIVWGSLATMKSWLRTLRD